MSSMKSKETCRWVLSLSTLISAFLWFISIIHFLSYWLLTRVIPPTTLALLASILTFLPLSSLPFLRVSGCHASSAQCSVRPSHVARWRGYRAGYRSSYQQECERCRRWGSHQIRPSISLKTRWIDKLVIPILVLSILIMVTHFFLYLSISLTLSLYHSLISPISPLSLSLSLKGISKWPYAAIGNALEVIPRTLAQNCGANVIRLMTDLRTKVKHYQFLWSYIWSWLPHLQPSSLSLTNLKRISLSPGYSLFPQHTVPNFAGSTWGVNGTTGDSADMNKLAIWEPYCVKTQTLKTAIERWEALSSPLLTLIIQM